MTIKQQGGVFGRNPTYKDVAVEGEVYADTVSENTSGSGVTVDGVLLFDGNAWVSGTNPTFRMRQTDTTDKNFSFRLNGDRLIFERRNDAFNVATQLLNVNTATGNIAFPDGAGIDFSATAGTGTSELFDDYEEGTWTPALTKSGTDYDAVSYAASTYGRYTKVGNMVFIQGRIITTSVTVGSASGSAKIGGFPFSSISTNGYSAFSLADVRAWAASYFPS